MNKSSTILAWLFGIGLAILLVSAIIAGAGKDGKGIDPAVLEAIATGLDAFSDD